MNQHNDRIFISCGQRTEEEKGLGNQIFQKVEELTSFIPYFAEYQTSLEGLTHHILMALKESIGFIVVLQKREKLPRRNIFRASVWIEQELAIAAFMQQVLEKKLYVAAYVEKGVHLEGMRNQLLLNPLQYDQNEDIINHLTKILPTWTSNNIQTPDHPLNIQINYKKKRITSSYHEYELLIKVKNKGSDRLVEYSIDLEFPRDLIDENYLANIPNLMAEKNTREKCYFRITENDLGTLYPDDSKCAFNIPYYVNDRVFNSNALSNEVKVVAHVKGYNPPATMVKSLRELQMY